MSQDFIYYWKEYRSNTLHGPVHQLNQNSARMVAIKPDDTVSAITLASRSQYALVARFRVCEVGENPVGSDDRNRWGRWFFKSRAEDTVYFEADPQPSVEPLIRTLGLTTNAAILGASFQGRTAVSEPLNPDAARRLSEYAAGLPVDTFRTLPGVTALLHSENQLADLVPEADASLPIERREYLREMQVRDRRQVIELKDLYEGKCQVTGVMPLNGIAGDITEAHHIEWLTRGGPDAKNNMVIVSPNVHRALHAADALFDRKDLSFAINGRRIKLKLNKHL